MEINYLATASLKPYKKNNKKHSVEQIQRIAESIKTFGFNQPIVIDEDNVILVGHARHSAARHLGLNEVPVVQLTSLSKAEKSNYRILDNKLSADAPWDYGALKSEFDLLRAAEVDLAAWGLEALEMDAIRATFAPHLQPYAPPVSEVSKEDIKKRAEKMAEAFQKNSPKTAMCCPECGCEFEVGG